MFTMMTIACSEAFRIGILYYMYTVLSDIWHTRGTAKKLLCLIKSDRICYIQFITLELTCDPKISLLCRN